MSGVPSSVLNRAGRLVTPAPPAPPVNASAVHRFFETSLYLLLLTGLLTVLSTGKLDPITSALALIALLNKGWRWWRGLPPELSEAAARRLTIGYIFFLPVDFLFVSMALAQGSQNQPLFAALLAVIHLLIFSMLARLYSARNTRDYLFLAIVAFAMVLVSAILTIDTAFLVFLVTFLLLCISTFMGLELRRSAEGAAAPPLASGTAAAKRLHRALILTTAGLSLGAVLFGAAIFLMLPRITAGFLSGYNFQPTVMSGFSDADVQLGQIGQIKQSPAVVMRVKPLRGPLGAEYWRGNALTSFEDGRWFTPHNVPKPIERTDGGGSSWYTVWDPVEHILPANPERRREIGDLRTRLRAFPVRMSYRVFLEPIGSDMLFMATQGHRLSGTFAPGVDRVIARRSGPRLNVDVADSVSNPSHNYTRLVYDADSVKPGFPAALLRQAGAEISPEIAKWYLQLPKLPELDPRIRQFTEEITRTAPTQYDKVLAVEQHLRTRYTYSLDLTGESLETFLFDRRAGHCEYFATAMAVMLRTINIPTRYARGFLGGEYNDVGDDWIVRARDAHSWVEVYFPDIGWVTFDPTPAAPGGVRGFLHRLSLYWDWAELLWIDWVVNYNFAQQNALYQSTQRQSARWSTQLYDWGRQHYDATVAAIGRLRRDMIVAAGRAPGSAAALLLSVSLAALYLWKGRALREWLAVRYGLRLGKKAETRLVTVYYQQMLGLLARRGLTKPPGQTAREFAAAVSASAAGAALSAPVHTVTTLFEQARYGTQSSLPQLSASLEALRAATRANRQPMLK